jgi:serine protease Do
MSPLLRQPILILILFSLLLKVHPLEARNADLTSERLGAQITAAQRSFVVVVSQPVAAPPADGKRAKPRRLVGCGVVLDRQGHLLTTSTVVQNARRVTVIPFQREPMLADVIGVDPLWDLAVLRLPSGVVPEVPMGNSDSLQTGAWVTLLAANYGTGPVASLGVLTGRSDYPEGLGGEVLRVYAPIRPGDSGAVLLNDRGEAVGIVSATLETSDQEDHPNTRLDPLLARRGGALSDYVEGIAIPMNDAISAAWQVIERGAANRGFLGVTVQPLSPQLARTLGLEIGLGAYVVDLAEGGPAAEAGVLVGDVIVALDGQPVQGLRGMHRWAVESNPGDQREMTVLAGGEHRTVTVQIGDAAKFMNELLPEFSLDPGSLPPGRTSVRRNELEGEVELLKARLEELEAQLQKLER